MKTIKIGDQIIGNCTTSNEKLLGKVVSILNPIPTHGNSCKIYEINNLNFFDKKMAELGNPKQTFAYVIIK